MRIGLVSYWFNRGQAIVARHLRGALESLGHETFVLARPTKKGFYRPGYVEAHDVWAQPRVTAASRFNIPWREYERWAIDHDLEAAFFDQNYQFDEIERLRATGVVTFGRFVWEAFRPCDVAGARRAYDVVYSMTRCERRRYRELSLDTPLVPWGCHPELERFRAVRAEQDTVTYYFPGGYLSRRKPLVEAVNAFVRADDPRLRLLVKTQGVQQGLPPAIKTIGALPRVTVIDGDLPTEEHHALMGSADVCLAPSRWEGLGLHLYEATGMGLPIITNDQPPMNEVVHNRDNGLLVDSIAVEAAPSGIPAHDPDPRSLADAIRRLAEPDLRRRLADGAARASTERLSWQHTIDGLRRLLEGA